ncbi:hypothetical protein COCVIDRAFT_105575 [Bipolaris victoriae FI3]|uniref:DUF7888 domain-containing protein n=1 Tax=Bipolaris victoriae (strain FI3) TaxID=930091 RepID=W7E2N5_BIPV3|nr:hypothetical protein COCVIDRAFT_105575 [Bipolaris victoriae FI3]
MQFSTIRNFSFALLAASALAIPTPTENTGVVANVEAPAVLEKRFGPITILLINVIGGKLLAGAISAGIERTKEAIAPSSDTYKTFEDARTAFMQRHIPDLYATREAGSKGVICMNGPYSISAGAVYDGPATEKFSWDIYHTTYDCFEITSGSITNNGDGGWINWGAEGCSISGHTISC